MPLYAWSCFVCQKSNAASNTVCAACSCPAHISNKEIQGRRAACTQSVPSTIALAVSPKYTRSRWFFILCLINTALAFGIMALGIVGGGNAIGAGMLAGLILLPAPLFLIAAGFFFVMDRHKKVHGTRS
jgi:hypothetical protein